MFYAAYALLSAVRYKLACSTKVQTAEADNPETITDERKSLSRLPLGMRDIFVGVSAVLVPGERYITSGEVAMRLLAHGRHNAMRASFPRRHSYRRYRSPALDWLPAVPGNRCHTSTIQRTKLATHRGIYLPDYALHSRQRERSSSAQHQHGGYAECTRTSDVMSESYRSQETRMSRMLRLSSQCLVAEVR